MWKSGASIASCRFSPRSTWRRKTCSAHCSCWSPPGVPHARYGLPSRRARPGESVVRGRAPGRTTRAALPRARTSARAFRAASRARESPASCATSRHSASPRSCCPTCQQRRGGPCRRESARRRPAMTAAPTTVGSLPQSRCVVRPTRPRRSARVAPRCTRVKGASQAAPPRRRRARRGRRRRASRTP